MSHRCDLKCGAILKSKLTPEAMEWDWFTGYGNRTVHFCPDCRSKHRRAINKLFDKLRVRPDGWNKADLAAKQRQERAKIKVDDLLGIFNEA